MAKRYKAEHGTGRSSRLPIPSFSNPGAVPDPERIPTMNHGTNNNTRAETAAADTTAMQQQQQQQPLVVVVKPWTKRDMEPLVRLVTAMEVHAHHASSLRSSTGGSSSSSSSCLGLDEFYALVRKTATATAAVVRHHGNSSQHQNGNDDDKKEQLASVDSDSLLLVDDISSKTKSKEEKQQQQQQREQPTPKLPSDITNEGEKLLYLLVCATGSVLYDLRQVPATATATATTTTRWCLQTLPCPKRVEKLRHLLVVSETTNTGISKERSDQILAAIREHRAMVQASKKKSNNKFHQNKTASSISSSLIKNKKAPQHKATKDDDDDDDDDDKSRFLAALESPQKHIIRPGMTVEERVRVREAQVKERKRLERAEQEAVAATNNSSIATTQEEQHGEWLLSLADVLFFRARDIWQRQERCFQKSSLLRPSSRQDFVRPAAGRQPLLGQHSYQDDQNNKNKNPPSFQASPCIMTLRDVLLLLSKSATTTMMPASLSSTRNGKKMTRRRIIVHAVQELSRKLPAWIQFTPQQQQGGNKGGSSGQNNNNNNNKLDPDSTTVWIKPGVSYTTIQTTLVPGSRKSKNNAVDRLKNNTNVVTQPSATFQQQQQQPHRKRFKVTSRKRPPPTRIAPGVSKSLFGSGEPTTATTAVAAKKSRTLASLVASATRTANHETSSMDQTSSFAAAATATTTPNGKRKMTLPPLVHSTGNGVADGATTSTTTTATHHHHAPSSPSTLRINPHLILTDADYSGGECLLSHKNARNNSSSSPRGLKSLFTQLNSGQRI